MCVGRMTPSTKRFSLLPAMQLKCGVALPARELRSCEWHCNSPQECHAPEERSRLPLCALADPFGSEECLARVSCRR